ncbi:hypothetical protein GCM10023350_39240 [Nocardioides endophyticus]|uniref:ABC transporter domain-containing protein n=1 Tax=Nocardioides endophyticus TaxID=1353775 RepID=A0ABP8Z9B0_9ACTN
MTALEVRDLSVVYRTGRAEMHAVSGVNLSIGAGRTVGLVGESGSGKSTVAKAIVGLVRPTEGTVLVDGHQIDRSRERLRLLRRRVQMIFQDPNSSLNPRLTVRSTLAEAAALLPRQQRFEVDELIDLVSLPPHLSERFPHELSGGQKQRVAIARALAVRPAVLVADEITASLDVSAQASVLRLLADLQHRLQLSCLFITHDLAVVKHVAHDIVVMRFGEVVERGQALDIVAEPSHEYTKALIAAVPRPFKATGHEPASRRPSMSEGHPLGRLAPRDAVVSPTAPGGSWPSPK